MDKINKGFFGNLKHDLPASLVVFLVALPLCLGIALVSGAPLFSGIIAGIVGGTVVALMSGSPIGVSGPAAGLAVIVLNTIDELGSFEVFLFTVVIAGVIQLLLGVIRAGVIGYYFPSSVIKGMLSGIGILIIFKEIPHAVGYDKDPIGDLAFSQPDGHNTFSEWAYMLDGIQPGSVAITLIAMVILILWEQPFMKKLSFTKIIQGPLVVVVSGILLNMAFQGNALLELGKEHVVNIPVADSIGGFFDQFTAPDFSQWQNYELYLTGLLIAVVASLETLLCVEATDKLDPFKRVTPTNRELIAQGTGNVISGFIGGLPITQVIVRSSANIQSGGRSKASAFFHGILLLICAMSIPKVLNLIPLSSLAAILFVVGYKLAKPVLFKEMYKKGWTEFVPFVVTIVGIVRIDLLWGIGLGLIVAIFIILYNNYRAPFHFNAEEYDEDKPIKISLSEQVSFLNKAGILKTLSQLPDGKEVIIDASKTRQIHPDILEIIEDFRESAERRNISIKLIQIEEEEHSPVEQFGHLVLKHPKKVKQ